MKCPACDGKCRVSLPRTDWILDGRYPPSPAYFDVDRDHVVVNCLLCVDGEVSQQDAVTWALTWS